MGRYDGCGLDVEPNRRYCRNYFANLSNLDVSAVRAYLAIAFRSSPSVCTAMLFCPHCPGCISFFACADTAAHYEPVILTSPRINIRISFLPHMSPVNSLEMLAPIAPGFPDSSATCTL